MSARRETDDTDPVRGHTPLLCLAPHESNGALGVLQRPAGGFAFRLTGSSWYAIFQDDPGHADGVEPRRNLLTLQLPVEVPVTAAGTDDDRGPGVFVLGRPIDTDGRFGHIGDHSRRFGDLDLFAIELGRHADVFVANLARLVRSFARPEVKNQGLVGRLN